MVFFPPYTDVPDGFRLLQAVRRAYAGAFPSFLRRTPGVRRRVDSLTCFTSTSQLKEIRHSNIAALRKALEHPTTDIEEAIHQLEVKYKDSPSEVLDEPDLMNYCAIDMAALKDVRSTGAEYALSLEALMQADYGPTPGYLPEADACNLLVGVSIAHHRAISLFI